MLLLVENLQSKNYTLELKMKPWVTAGIKNSIQIRNKLFKNYINKKGIAIKTVTCKICKHVKYKEYANRLSTLLRNIKI